MPRIAPVDPASAEPAVKATLDAVRAKLGGVPNLVRTFAVSPPVLNGWLGFSGALGKGTLGPRMGELLALAISEANGCEYCVNAHTAIGAGLKITPAEAGLARAGRAENPRDAAALAFALAVHASRGHVSDAQLNAFRQAGFDDAAALEIVGHVALNTLNNYLNHVAGTEVDFPAAPAKAAA
jgi:uncharacterized peroxidase-related enzyme